MEDVSGKTAFITGGASGMGLGMAKAFAEAGMKVIIADIRDSALAAAMKEFENTNLAVTPIKLDVTDREGWKAAVDEAEKTYGNIHVLALNAGVGILGPLQQATYKDWDFGLAVNLGGVVNGVMTVLPRMLAHGEESYIFTTSSTGGFSAVGGAGIYCTTKFAVAGFMETLATDLKGTNVHAGVFFPGPVQTTLNATTHETRPDHLKNEEAPPAMVGQRDARPSPGYDTSLFMTKEEVGKRILRAIRRNDLFIMTHPEFREGIVARNEALLRAIPDEPVNAPRRDLVKQFGTLMYNPIYDSQKKVPGEKF